MGIPRRPRPRHPLQPGTINEYPNWRVPLADAEGRPMQLEDVFRADLPRRLAAVMNGFDEQPHSRWTDS